jgi:hypothetical protein
VGASERDEFLRAAWRALVAGRLDARRFVFVDEMGANTSLSPISTGGRAEDDERTSEHRATGVLTSPCFRA